MLRYFMTLVFISQVLGARYIQPVDKPCIMSEWQVASECIDGLQLETRDVLYYSTSSIDCPSLHRFTVCADTAYIPEIVPEIMPIMKSSINSVYGGYGYYGNYGEYGYYGSYGAYYGNDWI